MNSELRNVTVFYGGSGPEPPPLELRFPAILPSEQRAVAEEARSEWGSAAPELPDAARRLGEEFFAFCEQYDAFSCRPGCTVDQMDDGSVMFDWNDGTRPMLSVLIVPDGSVAFAVKFKDGDQDADEAHDLGRVKNHLVRMMEECGHRGWIPIHTHASLSRATSVAAEAVRAYFSREPGTRYRSIPPPEHRTQTYKLLGASSPTPVVANYTGGFLLKT